MKTLLLKITLEEPLLVTQPQTGEENSSSSYDFIPGSALRGVAIRAYLRNKNKDELDLHKDLEARRLFFDGGLIFLNAYPAHPGTGARSLPRSLSWLSKKSEAESKNPWVYDYSIHIPVGIQEAMKAHGGRYFWKIGGTIEAYSPNFQITVHNASEGRQVKRSGDSVVYRYDALAAGEIFTAAVLASNAVDLNQVTGWFSDSLITLGGSHTAGYGRVKVELESPENWTEFQADPASQPGYVSITLLSDAILRTKNGQVSGDFDQALIEALGMTAAPKHQYACQRLRLVGGFNRKWGLPLPQAWAIQAGSTFVYPVGALDLSKLHTLAAEGLGERRSEGFGRLGINLQSQAKFKLTTIERGIQAESGIAKLSTTSNSLVERMVERRLRAVLDERLVEMINRSNLSNPPQKTQLSGLRVVVQRARVDGNLTSVENYLDNLKASKRQFERCRISDGETRKVFLEWIIERVHYDDFAKEFGVQKLPVMAGVTAALNPDIQLEYTSRLLDGVLRKAVKEKQIEEEAA